MRKTIHLLQWLALVLPMLLWADMAQAQVLYFEDFDGIGGPTAGGAGTYTFPAGMLKRNVDNRTPAGSVSYVNEAWERREDFSFNVVDSCAFSTSWYNPVGAADDWMWTPLVGPIVANTQLEWNAVAYDALYPDGYEVRVMTSSQGPPTGGSGTIGNQVTNSTQIFSIAAEASSWTHHVVSLSAYVGQSIYIAFRNNSNDKFLLLIDDISVNVQALDDAAMATKDTLEYTVVPEQHQSTADFRGTIRNNGVNNLTNAYLKVLVRDDQGTIVYNANSSTIASLAPSATSTLTVPNAGNLPPGDYTVQYVAMSSLSDPNATNDTLSNTYTVDTQVYSRDDGVVTGNLGIGAGNGGFLGQDFDFVQADVVDTIMVYFTRGYTGDSIRLNIYASSPAGPTTLLGTTIGQVYPDDSARLYMLAVQGGGVAVAGGSTYAFEVIEFDSTVAIGLTSNIFTPNTTWVNWPTNPFGTWANNEDFGASFAKPYVIRPMVACADFGIDQVTATPSCTGSNGTANVTLVSGNYTGATFLWSNGATTSSISALAPGNYTVTATLVGTCSATASVTVSASSANPPVAVATGSSVPCFGDLGTADVTASGGTPGYQYIWSTGDTTTTITAAASIYSVTVIDAQGCASTDTVLISQPSAVAVTIVNSFESAPGASDGTALATPSGGTAPYSYLWSNGSTTAAINGLTAGTYTVTITDANGCTVVDSTSIITGLAGGLPDATFRAFPSPNTGRFQVEFLSPVVADITLTIADLTGREVFAKQWQGSDRFNEVIDLRAMPAGIYLLQVRTADGQRSLRVEVQH